MMIFGKKPTEKPQDDTGFVFDLEDFEKRKATGKEQRPSWASHDKQQPWTPEHIFAVDARLAIIAVNAAKSCTLRKIERKDAFDAAMEAADKYIGAEAEKPSLRNQDAWDCFHNYIMDSLRL